MPITQQVIFTLVPNGRDGEAGLVNLHIAPRLDLTPDEAPAELLQFPSFAAWAETINAATIRVLVDGVPVRFDRLTTADRTVWEALLPPTTHVAARAFEDLRGVDVLTNPISLLAPMIEDDYVTLAGQGGDDLPEASILQKKFSYKPSDRMDRQSLLERLRENPDPRSFRNRALLSAWMAEYHRPLMPLVPQTARPDSDDDGTVEAKFLASERVQLPSAAELVERLDFHQIVSALGQHPLLMRACGLVVPLRVEVPISGSFEIQAEVDWDRGGIDTNPDITPVTLCMASSGELRARPRPGSSLTGGGGWLKLEPNRFTVLAMDADGAGLGLKNFAINLPQIGEERYDDEVFTDDRVPTRVGTPRLRSAGLQLAQIRRDAAIRDLFEGSGKLQDAVDVGTKPTLHAEDIIRGWRVDIRDDVTRRWQSLLRFDGTYRLVNTGEELLSEDEEGTLRLAASKAPDGSDDKLLKATEALFAWNGWSLAAPPVGKAILPDETHLEDPLVPEEKKFSADPEEVPDGLPLRTQAKAHKGSLPLLRFGRSYQIRMRYTDIAGGGVGWSPDDGPTGTATEPYFFGRYEPVEAPTLTLVNSEPDPVDGESMARAAVRTMDDDVAAPETVRRNIVPPRVSAKFAELHGVMDKGGRPDPSAHALMLARDEALDVRRVITQAFNPATGLPDGDNVETLFAQGEEFAVPPYLYDPMAAGVALRVAGLPDVNPRTIHFVPFYGDEWDAGAPIDWAEAKGFTVLAREGGTTGWNAARRTFFVALGKGERARIRLSALVPRRMIGNFKFLERLRALAEAGDLEDKKRFSDALALVRKGQHWMFTPWRTLELVHALQRPLVKPLIQKLSTWRSPGELRASINYYSPVHCKSTAHVDMDAEWIEIDDHGREGPEIRVIKDHAFRRKFARLDFPQGRLQRAFDHHDFADTRARHVDYRMTFTTRFREFMPLALREDAAMLSHESEQARTIVPSSTPPPPPVIRYVIPTFGWVSTGENDLTKRKWRRGGGIRVYLDRPWYASGSNEMLAVLLKNGAGDPVLLKQQDFVTQWGRDPVWAGQRVTTIAPTRTQFPRRVDIGPVPYEFDWLTPPPGSEADTQQATQRALLEREGADVRASSLTSLTPQGAPSDLLVDAVPHAVGYDRARKLWYCDIVVDPGKAYFPFIRLALARYQPNAVAGAELSSVAMAAFQQLTPDRVATVMPAPDFGVTARRVQIHGILPSDGRARPEAGLIRLKLQRLQEGDDPDLDWRDTDWGQQPPRPVGDLVNRAGNSRFAIPRSNLTQDQLQLHREGQRLIALNRLEDIVARPDLMAVLLPPLIDESVIFLPPSNGDRLRLLITEAERYEYNRDDYTGDPAGQERIIYAATFEL